MSCSTEKGILTLLRSAITGEHLTLSDDFSIEEALLVIKKHHMMALCYEGAVNCGISPKHPTMQQLFQAYYRGLIISERQIKAIEGLCKAFEDNDIDYLPLKGCNMKALYPKPELRAMGDADILIREEQYDLIKPIVAGLGFEEKSENDHEHTWLSKELYLELHKRLITSYNPDYFAYFGSGWHLAKIQNGNRYSMTVEDEFIYMFTHFARHYRDGGIGCRHVVDLWVYRRSYPKIDENYVKIELKKLHLSEFYENICHLLNVWFEDGKENEKTDFITDFIFNSGSWGQKDSYILSAVAKNVSAGGNVKSGKRKSWVKVVFQPKVELEYRYTILQKAPWLLPAIWVFHWFEVVLFRRNSIRKRYKTMQIATEQKVQSYQDALNYVGLSFNFK